ncbi:MAG: RNA-binding protein [Desulfurococcaceae archaeon]
MRLLGIAENWIKDGYLLVKPSIGRPLSLLGAIIHDSNGHRIGRVVDIIGRVNDPRIVVKLDYRELGELIAIRKDPVYYSIQRKEMKR